MDLPNEDQGFEILGSLSKIKDIGDFRLRELMRQHGMNPNQPVEFYRALIKAAREIMSFVKLLQETIDSQAKAQAQLGAKLASQDQQIKALNTKIRNLEGGSQQRVKSLENERRQLETTTSELKEKAEAYDGIKSLLQGKQDTKVVGALYRLFSDMYTDMQYADLGMKPPPNLAPVSYIKNKLRQQLLEALGIPKDTLEEENKKLKEHNDALVALINRLYRGGGQSRLTP